MSNLIATAYLESSIGVSVETSFDMEAEVYITSDSPINPSAIFIDSLDGGVPSDLIYLPINANDLTGISGGLP